MSIKKIQNTKLYEFLNDFKNGDAPICNKNTPYFAIIGNAFLIAPSAIILLNIFIILSPLLFILSLIKELIIEPLIKKEEEREELRKQELLKKEKLKILNNLEYSFMKYQANIHHNNYELCLDKYNHDNNLKLYEFILIFLNQLNDNHFTKYKYRSQYRNDRQCDAGRRRSLKDIYLICKNYYPTCNIYQVFNILIQLLKDNQISIQHCSTIEDYTFFPKRVSDYVNLQKPVNYFTKQFYHLNLEDILKIQITMLDIINHLNTPSYEKNSLS